jgi:hypothetical protein
MRSIWLEYLCYLGLDHELYFNKVSRAYMGRFGPVLAIANLKLYMCLMVISQWVVGIAHGMDCQRTVDLGDRKRFSAVTAGRCNRIKPSDQNFVVGISFSNFVSELIWTVRSKYQWLKCKTMWNCVNLDNIKFWSPDRSYVVLDLNSIQNNFH